MVYVMEYPKRDDNWRYPHDLGNLHVYVEMSTWFYLKQQHMSRRGHWYFQMVADVDFVKHSVKQHALA